jgi:hypothetical protein
MDGIRINKDWLGVFLKPWSVPAMEAFHDHLSDKIRNRIRNTPI